MTRVLLRTALLCSGLAASFAPSLSFAQGNTFNPYGNSGYADYREFTIPMYSNDPSLPGQARLQSGSYLARGRANQFGSYLDSLDSNGLDQFNANRGVPSGLPYYKAYQLYEQQNRRGYKPNDSAADRVYRARVAERNAAYAAAIKETDPKKRARMLQDLERDVNQRPLGSITNRSVAKPKTAKSGTARTAPATTPRITSPATSRATTASPPAATPATDPIPPATTTTAPEATIPIPIPPPL